MKYTFDKRLELIVELREKYIFLEEIEDIGRILDRVKEMRIASGNDDYHEKNFEELQAKLKGFQNTLYGLNATNKPVMTKQEMDDVFEAVKRGEINFDATYTIYTNRNGIGKHIVKERLPKEEAQAICDICNAEIKVPPHKNIMEMIGYMWILEEQ